MGNNAKPSGSGRIRTAQANNGNITVSGKDRHGQKEVELGEVNIDGRVYKPSVFYVLARSSLSWKSLDFQHNFVPKILQDAYKRPFQFCGKIRATKS
jgi:hypothetical protein